MLSDLRQILTIESTDRISDVYYGTTWTAKTYKDFYDDVWLTCGVGHLDPAQRPDGTWALLDVWSQMWEPIASDIDACKVAGPYKYTDGTMQTVFAIVRDTHPENLNLQPRLVIHICAAATAENPPKSIGMTWPTRLSAFIMEKVFTPIFTTPAFSPADDDTFHIDSFRWLDYVLMNALLNKVEGASMVIEDY